MKAIFFLLLWTIIVQSAHAQTLNYVIPPATQIQNLTELSTQLKVENAGLKVKISTLEYVVAVSDSLLDVKESRLNALNQEAIRRIAEQQGNYQREKANREKLESDNRRLAADNKRLQQNTAGNKIIATLAVIGTVAAILIR